MRRSSLRRGNLDRAGAIINKSLEDLGLHRKVLEHQAVAKWGEVVGPQIAAAGAAEKVRDGVLFVCCKSSIWCSELSLHKEAIMQRLNAAVRKKVIRDIRFSAKGFRSVGGQARKEEEPAGAKDFEAIRLDEARSRFASEAASVAGDQGLAERIVKAVRTSERLAELKRQEGWKKCPRCSCLHDGRNKVCDNCR